MALFVLHHYLLSSESMYPHCGPDDQEMSDTSSDLPYYTCDSDIVGLRATLNNDSMNIDVNVSYPSCTCNSDILGTHATLNNFVSVDDVPSAYEFENIQRLSRSSSQVVNSPAIALSRLFSINLNDNHTVSEEALDYVVCRVL